MARGTLLLATIALAVGIIALGANRVATLAQDEGAVLFAEYPADVAAVLLAADTPDLPPAPAQLRLDRLTLPPGVAWSPPPAAGPSLLAVEAGTLAVADAVGLEAAFPAGAAVTLRPGSAYVLRGEGAEPAILLRLAIEPPGAAAAAAPPESPPADLLFQESLPVLPAAPATLFLARLTFAPGADLGERAVAGPLALAVEAGELTVTDATGIEARFGTGQGLLVPGGAPIRPRNAGAEPAVVLAAGVVPAGQQAAPPMTPTPAPTSTPAPASTPPAPTATPTPRPAATATAPSQPTATSTPLPTATATAIATATATPLPTATTPPDDSAALRPLPASISAGTCNDPNVELVAVLADAKFPAAAAPSSAVIPVALSRTNVERTTLRELVDAPHAIIVYDPNDVSVAISCAEIVGPPDETDDVLVGLEELGTSGYSGVAWLYHADFDDVVSVALMLAPDLTGDSRSAPEPSRRYNHPVWLAPGGCGTQQTSADFFLASARLTGGVDVLGRDVGVLMSQTEIDTPLADLTGTAIVVVDPGDRNRAVACGEIGGTPHESGLDIGLREQDGSGRFGIVWLFEVDNITLITVMLVA